MEEQGIGRPSTYAPTVSTILDREYVIKEGKYLHITNLGRVVTAADGGTLQRHRRPEIHRQHGAAAGRRGGGQRCLEGSVLRDFYGDFAENLKQAEKDLEGVYIKVPDEVSPRRSAPSAGGIWWSSPAGSAGSLPAPAIPECNFTMPLVVEMPGRCPKCGGRLFKRTGTSRKSGKQYTYYCCEHTNNRARTAARPAIS